MCAYFTPLSLLFSFSLQKLVRVRRAQDRVVRCACGYRKRRGSAARALPAASARVRAADDVSIFGDARSGRRGAHYERSPIRSLSGCVMNQAWDQTYYNCWKRLVWHAAESVWRCKSITVSVSLQERAHAHTFSGDLCAQRVFLLEEVTRDQIR